MTKGFTLIELLIVIGIIAVLSVVVLLTLNPAELLRQSRDSNRISDLGTLKSALALYTTDYSGANYSLGAGANCYVDVETPASNNFIAGCDPDGAGTLPARFLAGAVTFAPAGATKRAIGTSGCPALPATLGWVPVNFFCISSGSPISTEPVDPAPNVGNGTFYGYRTAKSNGAVCTTGTDCTTYELNAHMESTKFKNAGSSDVESTDGGNSADLFEVGTAPGLSL